MKSKSKVSNHYCNSSFPLNRVINNNDNNSDINNNSKKDYDIKEMKEIKDNSLDNMTYNQFFSNTNEKKTNYKYNHFESKANDFNNFNNCNSNSQFNINYNSNCNYAKEDSNQIVFKNNYIFSFKSQNQEIKNPLNINQFNQEYADKNYSNPDMVANKRKSDESSYMNMNNYKNNENSNNDALNNNNTDSIDRKNKNFDDDNKDNYGYLGNKRRKPSNFITYNDIKFNDDMETEKKKKDLLNHVEKLSYFKYIFNKIFNCKACRGNNYIGVKIIDKSVTRENYSFSEYLLCRFQINTLINSFQALQNRVNEESN